MDAGQRAEIAEAKAAALEVLRHNMYGPHADLFRTAGWGYPEPYTRDLMISALGILASGDAELMGELHRVFESLADVQTPHGHIPSMAHDPDNVGASDTTPLFLLALAFYRRVTGEAHFLEGTVQRALTWMEYQNPGDQYMVAQLPTTDWRDEQWVMGYGLFVNVIVYSYLRLYGQHARADELLCCLRNPLLGEEQRCQSGCSSGLMLPNKPYFALWSFKIFSSERFDLLGNSLAVLVGLAPPAMAREMVEMVEAECATLRKNGLLAVDLPPNFFPYIEPDDPDWLPRYAQLNRPGEYHNGGIWPFVCGFYVVAALAAGLPEVAEQRLLALTAANRLAYDHDVAWGFNEWLRAQDGTAQGNDWQTWSAAMYLYAATCVEEGRVLFFDELLRGA